jgi:nucleotide-binding universal stress UspA family protein
MKTLLIPIDFTTTSENAINYAVEWCKAYDYNRIILLKTFYNSIFDAVGYMRVNNDYLAVEREETNEKLNALSHKLATEIGPDIRVSVAFTELPLLRAILNVIEDEKVELIVIGSDNYSYSGNSFIAGNVIDISRISPVRVLIVPSKYQYQPVRKVLVPFDFDKIYTLIKLENYQGYSAKWKDTKLLVLNIDPYDKHLHPDEQFKNTEITMHQYLKSFDHELYYSNNKNIINGIIDFSNEHEVQLITALPGKHSFLFSLTHKSISEAIYHNATKPVLILK